MRRYTFTCLLLAAISFQMAQKKASKKLLEVDTPNALELQQQFEQYYDDTPPIGADGSNLKLDKDGRRCFRGGWGWGGGFGGAVYQAGGRSIFTYGGRRRSGVVVIDGGGGGAAPSTASGGGAPSLSEMGGKGDEGGAGDMADKGGDMIRRAFYDSHTAMGGDNAELDAIDRQVDAESEPSSKLPRIGSVKRSRGRLLKPKIGLGSANKRLMMAPEDYYG